MTINATSVRKEAAGNGVTLPFPYPFRFLTDGDLTVLLVDDVTGVPTTQILGTHYNVTGAGDAAGGTVTFVTAPPTLKTVVIFNNPALTQGVDLVNNDPLPVETSVERPFDRLTLIAQRNRDLLERALRLPDGDSGFVAADMILPAKVTRKSNYLAFDANGKPIASAAQSGVPTTAFMATVLDDANAAAALSTLGVSAYVQTLLDDANAEAARRTLKALGVVETFAALKATTVANLSNGDAIEVLYRTTAGDGGGGLFRWVAADTTADNGGTILTPDSAPANGRWNRVFDAGIVNVKWFGAVADGATSDATAVANTIAALPNGGTVFLPAGTYAFSAGIALNVLGVSLVGAGRGATKIKRLSGIASGTATITVTGHYCAIRDLMVDNNSQNGDGVKWSNANEGEIRFCRIENVVSTGIALRYTAASANVIRDVFCNDCDRALLIETASNNIQAYDFGFSTLSTTNPAIDIVASVQIAFFGGLWEHKSTALKTRDLTVAVSMHGVYIENISTSALPDLDIGSGTTESSGFQMYGGYVRQNSNTGTAFIRVNDDATEVVIDGVVLVRGTTDASNFVLLAGGTTGKNWTIRNVHFNAAAAYTSINVTGAPAHVHIENVRDAGGFQGTLELGNAAGAWVSGTNMHVNVGATALRVVLQNISGTITDNSGAALQFNQAAMILTQAYIEMYELAADAAAPAPQRGRLYVKDNGAGKTQIVVRFNTGAVQVIATEP